MHFCCVRKSSQMKLCRWMCLPEGGRLARGEWFWLFWAKGYTYEMRWWQRWLLRCDAFMWLLLLPPRGVELSGSGVLFCADPRVRIKYIFERITRKRKWIVMLTIWCNTYNIWIELCKAYDTIYLYMMRFRATVWGRWVFGVGWGGSQQVNSSVDLIVQCAERMCERVHIPPSCHCH